MKKKTIADLIETAYTNPNNYITAAQLKRAKQNGHITAKQEAAFKAKKQKNKDKKKHYVGTDNKVDI